MNRRGFLGALVGGITTATAVRTWPFRVYSFPTNIQPAPLFVLNQLDVDKWAVIHNKTQMLRTVFLHPPHQRVAGFRFRSSFPTLYENGKVKNIFAYEGPLSIHLHPQQTLIIPTSQDYTAFEPIATIVDGEK